MICHSKSQWKILSNTCISFVEQLCKVWLYTYKGTAVVLLWYRNWAPCYIEIGLYHGTECLLCIYIAYLDIWMVNMEQYDRITKKVMGNDEKLENHHYCVEWIMQICISVWIRLFYLFILYYLKVFYKNNTYKSRQNLLL